ncbi:uncharacterized protein LOC134773526 isoform X2 [Penaeus indicus]|uniref:uncharacterized protein LOC134773526 isoform X2 n=1 Tax=Penaeus indicus TaxID=29960 RepID=UPI00300D1224
MESFCLDNIWKVGVLLLLVSHVASKDPRRPASVLRSDSSQGRNTVMENLSCASVNLESLVCRWETPKIPVSNYTMYLYNWLHLWDIKQSCTCYEEWCNSCPGVCCHWKAPAYDFTAPEIMIELSTGSNARNETFNQSLIVLPGEAEKLSISTTESYQELEVRWDTPKFLLNFDPGLFYSVDYRPKNVSVFGSLDWMSVAGHYCDKSATVRLTSLHGWVDYEVRVRLRSGARPPPDDENDDRWWSSVASEAVTSQGAPEVAPAVSVGTFEVESDADSGRRAVALQWRPVPPLLHNGPGLEYRVLVRDQTNNTVKDLTETGTFVRIEDLNKDTSYRMEITAANHVGVGHTTPAVRIPAAPPPAPLLPAVVYHAETRHYELWWPAKENLTYTAYVCTDGLSFLSPCTSNLYWKNLGSASAVNLTLEELNVTDSLTPDKVRFALSAETFAEDSSGMAWDSCVHPQLYNTQHSAPEIITDYDSTMNSVSLRWSADCAARGGVIEEVQAIWCEGLGSCDDAGNETPMKNESDVFSGVVVLDGLREGSDYAANLRLKYRGGFSGWSSPLLFSTKSSVLPTWLIVIIVIAAVAVTVVVLAAGVYSRRKIQVIAEDAQRQIILPEGLGDGSAFHGPRPQDDSSDIRSRNSFTTDVMNNHDSIYDNVQYSEPLSNHMLCLEKEYFQTPFSGGRGLAQSNVDKETPPLISQPGDVMPVFPNDVTGDKTGNGEDGYGIISEPSPGYSVILFQNSELHSNKAAIPSTSTNEVRTPYSRIYSCPEEFTNVKADEKSLAGHVASPSADCGMQTSSNLTPNGGRQVQRTPSTRYTAFPLEGSRNDTSKNIKENVDKHIQETTAAQPSPGYVAILPQHSTLNDGTSSTPSTPANEVKAPYSSVYRNPEEFKNMKGHDHIQETTAAQPSPGYVAILPQHSTLNDGTSSTPSTPTNEVKAPYSSVYRNPEEFKNMKGHKHIQETSAAQPSPGYVAILPQHSTLNNGTSSTPSTPTNEVKAPYSSVYRNPEEFKNMKGHEKSLPGRAVFPSTQVNKDTQGLVSTGFGMQTSCELIKNEGGNKHDTYSKGYVPFPPNIFGTQTSNKLKEDVGQKVQRTSSSGQVASPPEGFDKQTFPSDIRHYDAGAKSKAQKEPVTKKAESDAETTGYVMIDFPFASKNTQDNRHQSGANSESPSSNKEKFDEASGPHHYVSRIDGRSKLSSDQKAKTSGETPSVGYVALDFPFARFTKGQNSPNQTPNGNGHVEGTDASEPEKEISPRYPYDTSDTCPPIPEDEMNALCHKTQPEPDFPQNVPQMTVHHVSTVVTGPESSLRSPIDENVGSAASSGYVRLDQIYSGKYGEF